MTTSSSAAATALPQLLLSVAALDQAVDTILNNNFDADTKVCFITLMKVLDNLIQKPMDRKVRSIRLQNPAFLKRVASRPGGVDFLQACGFEQQQQTPTLLSKGNEPREVFLVLKDDDDDNDNMDVDSNNNNNNNASKKDAYKSHIIRARRLLMTRAIQDLHMKAEELPAYKPPPPPVATTRAPFTSPNDAAVFDPFQTQRYDGMSAAAGAQLTPDGTYQSSTDKQLKTLQQKQERLEQKLQQELMDREWIAKPPPSAANAAMSSISSSNALDNDNNAAGAPEKGSASLVAAQFQKQQAARQQREEGGFTTKSMRDLEKIKKRKVYTHTQLALRFADGTVVQGKFLPKETIDVVVKALVKDCLVEDTAAANNCTNIQLYVAPPKRVLPPTATLQDEGLVPAAKVSVSIAFSNNTALMNSKDCQSFLKPELFQKAAAPSQAAFPTSQPVVGTPSSLDAANPKGTAPAAAAKPPMTAEEKEAAMMARMMGGGRRLGTAKNNKNNSSTDDDKKKKAGMKKPSWMK